MLDAEITEHKEFASEPLQIAKRAPTVDRISYASFTVGTRNHLTVRTRVHNITMRQHYHTHMDTHCNKSEQIPYQKPMPTLKSLEIYRGKSGDLIRNDKIRKNAQNSSL
jgi:hypothetical protein